MMFGVSLDFGNGGYTVDSPTALWWKQLATAVVFGLGIATVLTLVVTPSLLALRCSTTSPASSTTIRSASTMVDSRCAMVITDRPCPIIFSSDWIERSVSVSSARGGLVEKQDRRVLQSVRAMPTRCFSPPESFRPRSPTWVS
jgi:hypothetical protein